MDCLLTMGILKMYEIILHWLEKRATGWENSVDIMEKNWCSSPRRLDCGRAGLEQPIENGKLRSNWKTAKNAA